MALRKMYGNWYIDYYEPGGKRVVKKVGKSKQAARDALAAIKADILRGEYRFKNEKRILFEDFAQEYLKYSKINKRSWKRDQVSLNSIGRYFKGALLNRISVRDVEDYKEKRQKEVSNATVNREIACLRHMYTKAMEWKYVSESPAKRVKLLEESDREYFILTEEQSEKLLAVSSPELRPVIMIALNTGMRVGEILSMRWSDIDYEAGLITIRKERAKSKRRETVPINSLVEAELRDIEQESEFVFNNPQTKTHIKSVSKAFTGARMRAGLTGLTLHDLRHTAATWMLNLGVDIVTVSKILRHSDIRITMRYLHSTANLQKHGVEALASVFKPNQEKITNMWHVDDNKNVSTLL